MPQRAVGIIQSILMLLKLENKGDLIIICEDRLWYTRTLEFSTPFVPNPLVT